MHTEEIATNMLRMETLSRKNFMETAKAIFLQLFRLLRLIDLRNK